VPDRAIHAMRSAHLTRIDAAAVSEDTFVFAYPLVLMELTRIQMTSLRAPDPLTMRAPPNRLVHARSRSTVSSSAWLDLGPAPVVLSVPETHGRYYCMSLIDMWTNGFTSLGPRTTGTGAGAYAIGLHDAGRVPNGALPITAPTRHVRLAGETCLEPGEPEAAAVAIERAYGLRSLGGPLKDDRRVPAGGEAMLGPPPVERVDRMAARTFFGLAQRLLADNPPRTEDRRVLDRARRIGLLMPGDTVWTAGDRSLVQMVEEGAARGRATVRARAAAMMEEAWGQWLIDYRGGGFGTDYLSRAAAARAPLRAELSADAVPALTRTDAGGSPLSGRHRYVLRFDPDAPPPVHGFWALSTHAAPRAGSLGPPWSTPLRDRDGLTVDVDGSLRIHIQHDRPPRLSRSNWLPAPAGAFALLLRLHWPREELLARRWTPPAVAREG
jgi:hypothetical protein